MKYVKLAPDVPFGMKGTVQNIIATDFGIAEHEPLSNAICNALAPDILALKNTIRYLAERHHDTIRNSKLHDPENRTWEECDCKPCKRAQEVLRHE